VGINWSKGRLTEAKIKSLRGERCRVKSFQPAEELRVMKNGKHVDTQFDRGEMEFDTQAGEVFVLTCHQAMTTPANTSKSLTRPKSLRRIQLNQF
jgi:hypothetical protein